MAENKSSSNPFGLMDEFPEAEALLTHNQQPLKDVYASLRVVIDASALLFPYDLATEPFDKIAEVFASLRDEGRLLIPSQSIREFAKKRTTKLADLSEQLRVMAAGVDTHVFKKRLPLLEGESAYQKAQEANKAYVNAGAALVASLKEAKAEIDRLQYGSDPLTSAYRSCLVGSIAEPEWNAEARKALEAEWRSRDNLSRPPGFKDAGIGDFLIWKTLLSLAEEGQSCLLVTEETKPDWWVKGKDRFAPRPELIDEYRAASKGGAFYMCNLSRLLQLANVHAETLKAVEEAERGGAIKALFERRNALQEKLYGLRSEVEAIEKDISTSRMSEGSIGRYFGGRPDRASEYDRMIAQNRGHREALEQKLIVAEANYEIARVQLIKEIDDVNIDLNRLASLQTG